MPVCPMPEKHELLHGMQKMGETDADQAGGDACADECGGEFRREV